MLRGEYRRALSRLGGIPKLKFGHKDADERLAEHLMELYWRGKLSLNPPDELLVALWTQDPAPVKSQAIGFVGFSLHNTAGDVPQDILARLMALWDSRLEALQAVTPGTPEAKELEEFGWWVAGGKFDPGWALGRLETVLKITGGRLEIGHLVMERLAAYAPAHIAVALRCADMMVKGESKGWGVLSWREQLRVILGTALAAGDADLRRSAEDLIHALGKLGHAGFRDLLQPK